MDNSLQIGASSGSDIDAFLEDFAGTPRLLDLFALCALLRGAVFSDGYTVDPRWAAAVVPSASGNELLRLESDIARGVSDAERMLALFLTFYHRPLFIDVERSSPEHLREIVTQEIFAEKLRWPYRFGRLLYDKFNSRPHPTAVERLEPNEVVQLLDGSPQGICQIGSLLSGPIGLIESAERRLLPATLSLCLWHCSDPGCLAPHYAMLRRPELSFLKVGRHLARFLADRFGAASRWDLALVGRALGFQASKPPRPRNYYDLPRAITDSIMGADLTKLVELACSGRLAGTVRGIIASSQRRKLAIARPADLATQLSPAEQLQILFVLADSDLISLIDEAIWTGAVRIPPTEVRKARERLGKFLEFDSPATIACFGVRSETDDPALRLASVILKTHSQLGRLTDLDWCLHKNSVVSTDFALASYLRERGPEATVKNLMLYSRPPYSICRCY